MPEENTTIQQPARVIVGHCPDCADVLVVMNNYETWPYIECRCGWAGDTLSIKNRCRYERGGKAVIDFVSVAQ